MRPWTGRATIARALTELHGGRLTLTSTRGEGTTVSVHLPTSRLADRRAHEAA